MPAEWETPKALPSLVQGELQLWRVDLRDEQADVDDAVRWLTAEERVRAERLRAGGPRARFAVARASLRLLLGRVLGVRPGEVRLRVGFAGKPEVESAGQAPVSFNVSHCGTTILIGMTMVGRVGVDVEAVDRAADVMAVAAHAFTPEETATLAAVDDEVKRRLLFFRCWTRKEAVVKADGSGLSRSLRSFPVPMGEARNAPVWLPEAVGGEEACYLVSDLDLGEQVAGAYAVDAALRLRSFRVSFSTLWCCAGGRQ